MKRQILTLTVLVVGFALGASALSVLAQSWTPPTAPPPSGNVAAPINTGGCGTACGEAGNAYTQLKTGVLALADLVVTRLNVADSADPVAGQVVSALDVNGTVGYRTVKSDEGTWYAMKNGALSVANTNAAGGVGCWGDAGEDGASCPAGTVLVGIDQCTGPKLAIKCAPLSAK